MAIKHYKSNMYLSGKGVFVWGKCDSWFRLRMPRGWGCQAATKTKPGTSSSRKCGTFTQTIAVREKWTAQFRGSDKCLYVCQHMVRCTAAFLFPTEDILMQLIISLVMWWSILNGLVTKSVNTHWCICRYFYLSGCFEWILASTQARLRWIKCRLKNWVF